VTSHRLVLILAGAVAVAAIAFAMIFARQADVPLPHLTAMLLAAYAIGLGLGWLVLKRRG
jgi:hypothetical protein